MMASDNMEKKWNTIYETQPASVEARPARVLTDNSHLLPRFGIALDVACGMGANGVFLARNGLLTHAWDISGVAISKLQQEAEQNKLPLIPEVRDILKDPPAPNSFDVIVVAHFLDRDLMPHLRAALRLEGLLLYQTFTVARVDDSGPRSEAYRLGDNELLRMCAGMRILAYREEGGIGDPQEGFRNRAYVVAQNAVPKF